MAEETKVPETEIPEVENTAGDAPVPEEKDEKKGRRNKTKDAAKLAAAEEKVESAERKAKEAQEQLLRTAAEYDNYRKRSQKERDAAFNDGVSHAAMQMLPIIDTLEAAANAPSVDEEYKKGVLLTLQQCTEVLKKLGIEEIPAEGQPFDPELHDAVMQQPAEGVESGTITNVVRKGYKLGDRVVRHCMVCVAP